jgi:hypothetical protein
MMMHPAHALLLANTHHHELVTRADAFRLARRTPAAAQPDCRIPVATLAAPLCRPDPRRAAAGPRARNAIRLHR